MRGGAGTDMENGGGSAPTLRVATHKMLVLISTEAILRSSITFFVTWGRNQKPGKTGLVSGRARSTISLVTSNSKTQILKLTKTNTNTNTHKYK